MIKRTITTAALALGLGLSAVSGAQTAEQDWQKQWSGGAEGGFSILDAATWVAPLKGVPGAVPSAKAYSFDPWRPDTWTAKSFVQAAPTPKFEVSRPSGWVAFLKPSTYAGMMNPATYSQFMLPEFWVQFVNPISYLSWMNPFEYTEFFNPLVYLQWINPGAYAPFMNPVNYAEPFNPVNYLTFVNPKAYLEWFNPEAYTLKGFMTGDSNAIDLLDMSTWTNSVATTFDPFNPTSWLAN